jgi:hypothetical protein
MRTGIADLIATSLASCKFHEYFSIKIFSQFIYFSENENNILHQISIVQTVKLTQYLPIIPVNIC